MESFPFESRIVRSRSNRATRTFHTELSHILNPCGDVGPTLNRACISLIEKLTSPDAIALHRLIYAEGGRFPEMRQIFVELAPQQVRHAFATFLEGSMKRGQLLRADPLDAARAFTALAMAGSHQQLLMGQIDRTTRTQIVADADFAVTLFLRAYSVDALTSPPATHKA